MRVQMLCKKDKARKKPYEVRALGRTIGTFVSEAEALAAKDKAQKVLDRAMPFFDKVIRAMQV